MAEDQVGSLPGSSRRLALAVLHLPVSRERGNGAPWEDERALDWGVLVSPDLLALRQTWTTPRLRSGITRPVPVHQAARETACTRHGIWLPRPGLPQLGVSASPEIITAQHRARRLLRRCIPEQLIYAQVEAATLATSGLPGREPSPGWEKHGRLPQKANPGLNSTAETELTRAARYPDITALTAKIITATRGPAPSQHISREPSAGRIN